MITAIQLPTYQYIPMTCPQFKIGQVHDKLHENLFISTCLDTEKMKVLEDLL